MKSNQKQTITVQVTIKKDIETVWNKWNNPNDIVNWYFASDDWHAPKAFNDLKIGGSFLYRMEAKDGNFGFDFEGVYTAIKINELIEYILTDDRKIKVEFISENGKTKIIETFDPETENPIELQQTGWQAILNNFKKYAEM